MNPKSPAPDPKTPDSGLETRDPGLRTPNPESLTAEEQAYWDQWDRGYAHWRKRVFLVFWISYGSFYLCRVNFSVAIPGIMEEFGWNRAQLGAIGTAMFWTYAVGQVIHGHLAERFSSRVYLAVAILLSALMNLLMGPAAGLGLLGLGAVWALNGFFQSGGWPNAIKTLSQWFSPRARGRLVGLYGTCYQFGNVMAWLLAGYAISRYGWRGTFVLAPLIFAAIGLIVLIFGRNRPEDAGLPPLEVYERYGEFRSLTIDQIRAMIRPKSEKEEYAGLAFVLQQTAANPQVWAVAWASFFVGVVKYGLILWSPTYLFEVEQAGIAGAAYTAIAVPGFGMAGAVFSGWASDRWFQSRRAPIAAILMAAVGILALLFYYGLPHRQWALIFLVLGLMGFGTLGTEVMLSGAVPIDFATRKAAGAAAGFIDFFGYFGAGGAGLVSGWLVDQWGWGAAFWFWTLAALASAIICAGLWSYKPPPGKYL